MDRDTLLAAMDFGRQRLIGTLDAIEKSGADVQAVLAWRPGPGRAHIGWQAMHCAATLDKYINTLRGQSPRDPQVVADFGGGSCPSDEKVPDMPTIRQALAIAYETFRGYVAGLADADLDKIVANPGGKERKIGESIILLTWHEAHHQGQMHITWNMYKAAHGVK